MINSFANILNLLALMPCTAVSYSLPDSNNIPFDHKIIELFSNPQGIFIEAGAHDGITQSNTKLLEEFYGWTGVLIEPSESLYEVLTTNRPNSLCFQCALGAFEQHNTYVYGDFDGALMSSVEGKRRLQQPLHRVLIRSLQSILDDLNLRHIDFFSLDAEGYELEVLKGIDFNKTSFDYILIEVYNFLYPEIVKILKENGYEIVENFSHYNHTANPDWDGTHDDYLFQKARGI